MKSAVNQPMKIEASNNRLAYLRLADELSSRLLTGLDIPYVSFSLERTSHLLAPVGYPPLGYTHRIKKAVPCHDIHNLSVLKKYTRGLSSQKPRRLAGEKYDPTQPQIRRIEKEDLKGDGTVNRSTNLESN